MRVTVIGAGAIGGYVGGKLALSGNRVTLVDRPQVVEAIKAGGGLGVIEPDGERLAKLEATADLAGALAGDVDLVLLAVKSYDTPAALEELKPHAGRFSRLLSLQNGVSNEELLAQAFGRQKVLAGTITHPVSVPAWGTVRSEKKRGGVVIAPLSAQSVESLVQAFREAGFQTQASEQPQAVKWSKLLLNVIGNATAAILDMNSKQVFAHPELAAVEIAALREALAVMKAQEIRPIGLPGYPVPLLAVAVRFLPVALLSRLMRPLVVSGRAEKLPSLLIEIRRGTGKSEIGDLNGAVAQAGKQVGLPTPVNDILATTLSLLVHNPQQRERWREQPDRLVAVIKAATRAQARREATPGA